jgi:restriction system protein
MALCLPTGGAEPTNRTATATNASSVTATNAVPDMAAIDVMAGARFEKVVYTLLRNQGYDVGKLRESNDFGVDMIANKGEERIAVQVKRSKNPITRKAIADAVSGMKYYKCTRAMVVTNSEFTEDAREFGRGTECTLIDRAVLQQWLDKAKPATDQRKDSTPAKQP